MNPPPHAEIRATGKPCVMHRGREDMGTENREREKKGWSSMLEHILFHVLTE